MNTEEDLQSAFAILQAAREQGAHWLAEVRIEKNRRGELTLRINAPKARSAEVNAMLARSNLYAAELHPFEGSLEEVYLELTSAPVLTGTNTGMASLSRGDPLWSPVGDPSSSPTSDALWSPVGDPTWAPSGLPDPASQSLDNRTRGIE